MLTGNKKIKDIENDDICNWLGNSLSAVGAERVRIEIENNHLGEYRVLYVNFKNCETRIALIGERAINSTIQEIRNLILMSAEHKQKKEDKRQCRYRFQDKDKFDGQPYCTFFNEQYADITFICDKNCEVFEQNKLIDKLKKECGILERRMSCLCQSQGDVYYEYYYADKRAVEFEELAGERYDIIGKLENELNISHNQYSQVVQQNKNLQSDLRRYQSAIDKIEEFTESIYEHIPEDNVLRQILNIVGEVKY